MRAPIQVVGFIIKPTTEGEVHVRNLLEGHRVAVSFGGSSTVAYTPDSFGHPAQFPQLFAGFGLGPFVYWRGNADELAELPADDRWRTPDGSEVVACHLGMGTSRAGDSRRTCSRASGQPISI